MSPDEPLAPAAALVERAKPNWSDVQLKARAQTLAQRVTCSEFHEGVLCEPCRQEGSGCLRAWAVNGQWPNESPADRATAPAPQVDHDRLVKQCLEISILLADAGIEACPLPEGVRRLIAQRDVPAHLIATCRTRAVGIAAKRNIGSHDQRTEFNARDRGLGYGYEDCADELEAALRAVPSRREPGEQK